eukprot:403354200
MSEHIPNQEANELIETSNQQQDQQQIQSIPAQQIDQGVEHTITQINTTTTFDQQDQDTINAKDFSKPKLPTVYPPNQPTIIIGPNSIRAVPNPNSMVNSSGINSSLQIYPSLGQSANERANRRLRELYDQENMGQDQRQQEYDDDYDEDDEDLDYYQETLAYPSHMYGIAQQTNEMMDFMTWDLIVKNTPKLMLQQIEMLIHKNQIKNKKFFTTYNDYQYNPPFMIFYSKKLYKECSGSSNQNDQNIVPQDASIGNFQDYLGIPHQCELTKFYEEFNLMKYPKLPIMMIKRKFFIVGYEPDLIHAIDGLGKGIIILSVNGNFLMKIYDEKTILSGTQNLHESYLTCIKPMLELASVLQKS